MRSEEERCWGLRVDTMVNVCIRNTNVNMAWTWMLWFWDALGTRTILWYGHGCPGFRMHSDDERYHGLGYVWAWIVWLSDALGTRTLSCGHGRSGYCTHSEHERYYGLGMYALVILSHSNIEKRDAWYTQYIFGALETLRMRGSCHAGHIPRGRPNMQIRSEGANSSSSSSTSNNNNDDDDNKTKYLPLHP